MNEICKIRVNTLVRFVILKHLQANDLSFVTINNVGKTFCEGSKFS